MLLKQNAADTHADNLLGMALAAQEKYAEAAPHFAAACGDKREKGGGYYLGRAQFATAHFEAGILSFQKELSREDEAFRGKCLLGSGLAWEAMSDPRRAEEYYRQAISAGDARAPIDYGLFLQSRAGSARPSFCSKSPGRSAKPNWSGVRWRAGRTENLPVRNPEFALSRRNFR